MTNEKVEKAASEDIVGGLPIRCINYKGMYALEYYQEIAETIENFEVRDDDIWVCSFPKTGTTWTQEMVWGICNDIHSDAAKVPLIKRCPNIVLTAMTAKGWEYMKKSKNEVANFISNSMEYSAKLPSPRHLKTHLPFHLLPKQLRSGEKKCKIVYVMRNPKDTCISYFHHYKLVHDYNGSFEEFAKLFLTDQVIYAPFWDNVVGFWENKSSLDILFLKYENMKADLGAAIKQTAAFLGKTLDDKKLRELQEHLSFANMKANPAVNNEEILKKANEMKPKKSSQSTFIRKGDTGQWKTEMSSELISQFDHITDEKLKNWPELRKQFS